MQAMSSLFQITDKIMNIDYNNITGVGSITAGTGDFFDLFANGISAKDGVIQMGGDCSLFVRDQRLYFSSPLGEFPLTPSKEEKVKTILDDYKAVREHI